MVTGSGGALGMVSAWFWNGLNDCGMVWEWFGNGWGVVGRSLALVWDWFGAGLGNGGGQWDGEIWVTIRAGLLSHWPAGLLLLPGKEGRRGE